MVLLRLASIKQLNQGRIETKQNCGRIFSEQVNVADRSVAQNLFGFDRFGGDGDTAVTSAFATLRFSFGCVQENREIEVGNEVDAGGEEDESGWQEDGAEYVQADGELKKDGGDGGVHACCEQNVAGVLQEAVQQRLDEIGAFFYGHLQYGFRSTQPAQDGVEDVVILRTNEGVEPTQLLDRSRPGETVPFVLRCPLNTRHFATSKIKTKQYFYPVLPCIKETYFKLLKSPAKFGPKNEIPRAHSPNYLRVLPRFATV